MMQNIEEMQKLAKENMDLAVTNITKVNQSFQAIAMEASDYAKKSFEEGTKAAEQAFGAKSIDKLVEVQSEYAKSAYESHVSEMNKMGEMFMDLAKDMYSPIEKSFAQLSK